MKETRGPLAGTRDTEMYAHPTSVQGIGLRSSKPAAAGSNPARCVRSRASSPQVTRLGEWREQSLQPRTVMTTVYWPANTTISELAEYYCYDVAPQHMRSSATDRLIWLSVPAPTVLPAGLSIGQLTFSELSTPMVARWHAWLTTQRAAATANHILSFLSVLCRQAKIEGLLEGENPCDAVRRNRLVPRKTIYGDDLTPLWRAIDTAEEKRVEWSKRFTDTRQRVFARGPTVAIRVLLLTGARMTEVTTAPRSSLLCQDGRWAIARPTSKTGRPRRINLSAEAVEVLGEYQRQLASAGVDTPWLFPRRHDPSKPIASLKKAWARIRALIEQDMTVQDLRKSFMATALVNGASIEEVAGQAGHANVSTTQRHYTHFVLNPRAIRAADAFASFLRGEAA